MMVYHCTPGANERSILRWGLQLSYCRTAAQGVWTAKKHRVFQLLAHVRERYQLRPAERVAVFACGVQPSWCVRRGGGIWLVTRDIPPDRVWLERSECWTPAANGTGVSLLS